MQSLFIVIFIFLLIFTIISIKKLQTELGYLPEIGDITFTEHHLINRNITHIIDRSLLSPKTETTIFIMSPTCGVCHEKLEVLLRKKKHLKSPYLFYAEAVNKQEYKEMASDFSKEIDIKPLYLNDLQRLDQSMFPLFLVVDSNGIVKRVYLN